MEAGSRAEQSTPRGETPRQLVGLHAQHWSSKVTGETQYLDIQDGPAAVDLRQWGPNVQGKAQYPATTAGPAVLARESRRRDTLKPQHRSRTVERETLYFDDPSCIRGGAEGF